MRAVHRLGQIGFKIDPNLTRLDHVYGKWIRGHLNIWVESKGSSHWLKGSESSSDFKFETQQHK